MKNKIDGWVQSKLDIKGYISDPSDADSVQIQSF